MTVTPSASVAAIMMLAVPRTVGPTLPPRKPRHLADVPPWRTAFLNVNLCSQCLEALEVQVNRRVDDAATGIDTLAFPLRASNGPNMQIEPRILRIRS